MKWRVAAPDFLENCSECQSLVPSCDPVLSWAGARILKVSQPRGEEAPERMETGLLTLTNHDLRGLSAVGVYD